MTALHLFLIFLFLSPFFSSIDPGQIFPGPHLLHHRPLHSTDHLFTVMPTAARSRHILPSPHIPHVRRDSLLSHPHQSLPVLQHFPMQPKTEQNVFSHLIPYHHPQTLIDLPGKTVIHLHLFQSSVSTMYSKWTPMILECNSVTP